MQGAIQRQTHISERMRNGFSECAGALTTTEPLMTSQVFAESLAFNLAVVARHFGLAFFGPIEPK